MKPFVDIIKFLAKLILYTLRGVFICFSITSLGYALDFHIIGNPISLTFEYFLGLFKLGVLIVAIVGVLLIAIWNLVQDGKTERSARNIKK
jgi:hypothetical protein